LLVAMFQMIAGVVNVSKHTVGCKEHEVLRQEHSQKAEFRRADMRFALLDATKPPHALSWDGHELPLRLHWIKVPQFRRSNCLAPRDFINLKVRKVL
jgi:hypothetical protein